MKQIITYLFIVLLFGCAKSSSDAFSIGGGATGQGGSLARFTISGNYLYTVDKQDLKVFDISNPAQAIFKTTIPVGFEIETIFPFKDKLFIGSTSRVYIFSLTNPAQPQKMGEAISPNVMRRCDPVVAKDNVAYATLRTNGPCGGTTSILAVYNITDVTNPVQVTSRNVFEPYGLGYSGNTLYVCDRNSGLLVFDITQPYDPVQVKAIQAPGGHFIDVIPYNNILIAWTVDGMVLYDIVNPVNPELIKEIN